MPKAHPKRLVSSMVILLLLVPAAMWSQFLPITPVPPPAVPLPVGVAPVGQHNNPLGYSVAFGTYNGPMVGINVPTIPYSPPPALAIPPGIGAALHINDFPGGVIPVPASPGLFFPAAPPEVRLTVAPQPQLAMPRTLWTMAQSTIDVPPNAPTSLLSTPGDYTINIIPEVAGAPGTQNMIITNEMGGDILFGTSAAPGPQAPAANDMEVMRIFQGGPVHIGPAPAAANALLTVAGGVNVANSTSTIAGTIRWNGTNLQVQTGSGWLTLNTGGGGGGDSDWVIGAGQVTTQNNVGIFNTSPAAALDVTGSAIISQNLTVSGNASITGTTTLNNELIVNGSAGNSGDVLVSQGTGASPQWQAVPSSTPWSLFGNGGTTPGTNFLGTTDAQDLVIKTNNAEVMRIQSGGNVGIGTASPSHTLDVVGSLQVSGTADLDGAVNVAGTSTLSGLLDVNNSADIQSNLVVGGTSTLNGALDVNSSADIQTTLVVGGTSTLNGALDVNSSADIQTTLVVGGASTLNGALDVNSSADIQTTLVVGGTSTLNSALDVNSSADIQTTLVVGGTSTLNGALDVDNSADIQTTLTVGGTSTLNGALDLNSSADVQSDLTVGGVATFNGNADFTERILLNGASGAAGQVLTSNGATLDPTWETPSAANSWERNGNAALATEFLGTTNNEKLAIRTNNLERVRIEADGDVGIGLAAPSARLHGTGGSLLWDGVVGATPVSGAGTRLMWIPSLGALRAGRVSGSLWDNANIGARSVAFGDDTKASGINSAAFGEDSRATAQNAFAYGDDNGANGLASLAGGFSSLANGNYSVAIGNDAYASALESMAFGKWVDATASNSVTIGKGTNSITRLNNNIANSLMVGFGVSTPLLFAGGTNNRVGIKTTAPACDLTVNGSASKPGGGSWLVFSDARLKKDIRAFEDGLAIAKQIRPVFYKYNGLAGLPDAEEYVGVLAQEIEEVAPYTITKLQSKMQESDAETTELYGYDPSSLPYIAINAIQELDARDAALDTRLAEQDAYIAGLETELQEQRRANAALSTSMQELSATVGQMQEALALCCQSFDNQTVNQRSGSGLPGAESRAMLGKNEPNPFTGVTTISMFLPEGIEHAELIISEASSGRIMQRLALSARGNTMVQISSDELQAGAYVYQLMADSTLVGVDKMIVVK